MSLIKRAKKQKAIFWKKNGRDAEGVNTFDSPIVIPCRWEDKTQNMLDTDGNAQVSRARVMIDEEYKIIGSVLKKVPEEYVRGQSYTNAEILALLSLEDNPYDNEEAWEIRQVNETPNIRNSESLIWALL